MQKASIDRRIIIKKELNEKFLGIHMRYINYLYKNN